MLRVCLRFRVLFALTVVLITSNAWAVIVYNNGVPNSSGGNEMTMWLQTEDFTLTSAQTITDVRFWSAEGVPGYNGSITWRFYSQVAGQPGAVLFSGSATPVRAATGNVYFGLTERTNDFSIGAVTLPAGTYYLGLHNGPLTHATRDEFYWADQATNGTPTGFEDQTPFDDGLWFNNGSEHAFQLSRIPEPTGLAMLFLAAPAMIARRRRT